MEEKPKELSDYNDLNKAMRDLFRSDPKLEEINLEIINPKTGKRMTFFLKRWRVCGIEN